ncbi:MAG: bifunctional 2-C-methyl-D-erythritol 4-phosphate cytidylyltransferase/2-C-methyl-D-erythritol 2,4-cyclodiphosphate synthase [Hyphomonadaceae bacterium]|nr:bifunctional 2-C-methyl-D-erythritol 4-phosphate cytidylyltransferase/2-C-methyl-D-erythritol 2,4-cyclodiphosphate synthase [Hyphomonadaceae bacterium]
MAAAALIVAAGRGQRAGAGLPKQFRPFAGRPMLRWSLDAFRAVANVQRIVVVADPADATALGECTAGLDVEQTAGGPTRTASVRAGLEWLAGQGQRPEWVLIHDAARPGVSTGLIESVLDALQTTDAAAPALAVADALKRTDDSGAVVADVGRDRLWRVQTPQGFAFGPLLEAYRSLDPTAVFEDDLAVARAAGMTTRLVPGSARVGKITFPEDHALMEMLVGGQTPCVGTGFDAHRFGPGDHVTLCGVRIPHDRGLLGHSDADAGLHALTDALLGAIGAGDIGDHFPPSDPQWRGADSAVFLRHAVDLVARAGGRIVHADITLICERPKIGPHRVAMRARTADLLGLTTERTSVKATTTERMGFTGREEGLAAQATATVLLPL